MNLVLIRIEARLARKHALIRQTFGDGIAEVLGGRHGKTDDPAEQ